ncbi:hypothetical protein SDC9_203933 [bioreactor metagenome]|uniref:Uncharacterized protein n=1 Tax=bioreactor metagenome TaxID=1076179 RepID=A0A645IYL0_9ZZZZ
MLGIGSHTLYPVGNHFSKRANILIFCCQNADGGGFFQHSLSCTHCKNSRIMQALCINRASQIISDSKHFNNLFFNRAVIKIGIGNSHKKTVQNLIISSAKPFYIKLAFNYNIRKAFKRVNQKILQLGHFFGFAAHAAHRASLATGGFLTLITKHTHRFYLLFF